MKDDTQFWVEETNNELLVPVKRKRKSKVKKKLEYIGWGSKPLLEFLASIDKNTNEKMTQRDVSSIIMKYVNENNLNHPTKKKRVLCDEKLYTLFGKRFFSRLKISDLLEPHFEENRDESDDSQADTSDEDDEFPVLYKEKKANTNISKVFQVNEPPKSVFAALITDNIKLVYLKRSLVLELWNVPECAEEKIKGSFVRIKSDPNDYLQKYPYQLQQVTGTWKINDGKKIILQVTNAIEEIPLSNLSNDNFTEEEVEDLRERVKAGLNERPTVVEFDAKAKMLHEDITKHWIEREIVLLQPKIDRANEKGWRRDLFELMERKKLLESESEQKKLLMAIPRVIPEEIIEETSLVEQSSQVGVHETPPPPPPSSPPPPSPPSPPKQVELQEKELLPKASVYGIKIEEEIVAPPKQKVVAIPKDIIELSDSDEEEDKEEDLTKSRWHYLDPQGNIQGPFEIHLFKQWREANYFKDDFMVWKDGQTKDQSVLLISLLQQVFPGK